MKDVLDTCMYKQHMTFTSFALVWDSANYKHVSFTSEVSDYCLLNISEKTVTLQIIHVTSHGTMEPFVLPNQL